MRIIAGSRKGHRIAAPKGHATRPTSDFVRESAFNLIGPVDGASVLDVFAGSGALGLEALSRGAASAVFVESDREACRTIDANLGKLRLEATVVCQDVVRALAAERRTFDLVLCDPPYDYPDRERLAPELRRVLAPGGLLVYQTAARDEPAVEGLRVRTSRRYGSARLTLFELEADGTAPERFDETPETSMITSTPGELEPRA
ncbi:MAG TPA: 16S rRNA (guanine(966)-N(2))-methyltransferase RsmD [Gaiellaceae bacterium]|nr:16S rRNA (guanine(966)-N(2))-methyltransferase RsmD [Gaiellaceae bacterium]